MKTKANLISSIPLDSEKITVTKVEQSHVQLMFEDYYYASVIVKTPELLEYLEELTEKVRLLHLEQSPREL
ncbi:MAG: hypothetical protein V3T23_01700 [Nitrososphaerales archaeon]